jgi:hypothetical protein
VDENGRGNGRENRGAKRAPQKVKKVESPTILWAFGKLVRLTLE